MRNDSRSMSDLGFCQRDIEKILNKRIGELEGQMAEKELKNAELQATITCIKAARKAARAVTDEQIKDLKAHLATQEDHSLWIFKTKVDPNIARWKITEAQAARLQETLRVYGRHRSNCKIPLGLPCSCGFKEALASDDG